MKKKKKENKLKAITKDNHRNKCGTIKYKTDRRQRGQ